VRTAALAVEMQSLTNQAFDIGVKKKLESR
jgi:hypothetical protein